MASSTERTVMCNRLLFRAVNNNGVSLLKFAKRTYSPVDLFTSLAQCNEEGETPLVVAMKGKNVSVIDEMVTWIARYDDFNKEDCKPIAIIIINQLSQHIPIMELIEYLIINCKKGWWEFITQVFIKSTSLTRQNKIIALELIGAYAIMYLCEMECWREAMTLRYFPQDGEHLLPKIPSVFVPSAASSVVFGSYNEVMTMEELDLLQEVLVLYNSSHDFLVSFVCQKLMKIQAFLVIRRICSQANLKQPYRLYLESLLHFGKYLVSTNRHANYGENHKLPVNIFLLILEEMNGFDTKLLSRQSFDIFMKTLGFLATCFYTILKKPPNSLAREELTYENLLTVTKFITTIQWDHFDNTKDRLRFAGVVYTFLFILTKVSPQMTNEEKQKLEEYYAKYIPNFPERTTTVLHAAVRLQIFHFNYDMPPFNLKTFKMILQLGADPNAIDEEGRTALHILAGVERQTNLPLEQCLHIFKPLVDAGTHLDMASDYGDTILSILEENVQRYNSRDSIVHPYYQSLLNTVFPLTCYAARVIRRHRIPFDEDRLPPPLQRFVASHGARGSVILHQRRHV